MPLETLEWFERLKAVEREYRVVRIALDRLAVDESRDPTIRGRELWVREREIGNASGRMEDTYVLRLFAEFETGLRLSWAATRVTPVPDRITDIVDSIAARQGISDELRGNAHRRSPLSESTGPSSLGRGEVIAIDGARRYLCLFLGTMPTDW